MELFIIMIAWILGIIIGLYLKTSMALFLLSIIIFIIFIIIFKIIISKKHKIDKQKIKVYFLCFMISFIISGIYIINKENNYNKKYNQINEEQELNIVGTIISCKNIKEYKIQYILKIESIENNNTYKNTKVLLNVKYKDNDFNNKNKLNVGDKICFIGNINHPTTERNENGFDYKEYLKTQEIYEIANTKIEQVNIIKKNNMNFIYLLSNKVKMLIEDKTKEILAKDESNLLIGILLGDKSDLNNEIENDFRISNLSHVLAVSGMHVSYVIIGINFILNKIYINKKFNKIIIIILLSFFMILTGGTPSVKRACIMSIYLIIGNMLYRKTNSLGSISFSALIILIQNPYSLFNIGFELSYLGTIGIICIYPKLKEKSDIKINKIFKNSEVLIYKKIYKILEKLIDIILISISANLLIFPIVLINFNTFSTIFILSNILVSPLIGIIIILGYITIFIAYIITPIQIIFSTILNLFLKLLINITHMISKISFAQILFPTPKIYIIIFYYIFLIYVFFIRKILKDREIKEEKQQRKKEREKEQKKEKVKVKVKEKNKKEGKKKIEIKSYKSIDKIIVFLILIFIIIKFITNILPGKLEIDFIDVGQGDSTLIITPNKKSILIDGGGLIDNKDYDIGENVVLPFLLNKGLNKLDYIFISHFDTDHVQGILTILEKIKVKEVIIGKQFEENENLSEFTKIVNEKNIKVRIVESGMKIYIEKNLYFDVLWTNSKKRIMENGINNNALVLKLNYITTNKKNNFTMLFTGDIEEEAENILISEYKNTNELKSIILKVGHHGSKSSSTQGFLDIIKPKIALIGVGKDNKFGHPNGEVILRLENLRCKIYRTDQDGEISIIVNNKGKISVKKHIE